MAKKSDRIDLNGFCKFDILARLLLRLRWSGQWLFLRASLIALCVDLLGIGVGGTAISLHYAKTLPVFLTIYDYRQLPVVIFVYGIAIPLMCGFFLWDLKALPDTFRHLTENRVIFEESPGEGENRKPVTLDELLLPMRDACNSWPGLALTVILVAAVIGIVSHAIFAPAIDDSFRLGFSADDTWWTANNLYFGLVWAPITFSAIYMIGWILYRRLVMARALGKVFRTFRLIPIVLQPDDANGMAPIGNFAMLILLPLFLGAFWITFFVFLPVVFGFPPNLKLDMYLYIAGYVVCLPLLLVWPVWSTHNAMVKAKERILTDVANNVNDILLAGEYSTSPAASETDGQVGEAELRRRKYLLIQEQVGVWPFSRPKLLRNVLGAIIPLLPTLSSPVFQLLSKFVHVTFFQP